MLSTLHFTSERNQATSPNVTNYANNGFPTNPNINHVREYEYPSECIDIHKTTCALIGKHPNELSESEFRRIQNVIWKLESTLFIETTKQIFNGYNLQERVAISEHYPFFTSFAFTYGAQIEPVEYLQSVKNEMIRALVLNPNSNPICLFD